MEDLSLPSFLKTGILSDAAVFHERVTNVKERLRYKYNLGLAVIDFAFQKTGQFLCAWLEYFKLVTSFPLYVRKIYFTLYCIYSTELLVTFQIGV